MRSPAERLQMNKESGILLVRGSDSYHKSAIRCSVLSLRKMLREQESLHARKRLSTVILILERTLTAAQIAARLNLARSTVFVYWKQYREGGVPALLARTKPGRPATTLTPALEQVVIRGLRLLRWFNVPALQEWIRGHDHLYPEWTVRRWSLMLIKRLKMKFPWDWQVQMCYSYAAWRQMWERDRETDNPLTRWKRIRAERESTEPSLNLVVENSSGLRPWFPLAA